MASGLEGDELIEYINKKFEEQGIDATIALTDEGYVLTYGLYSRKVASLDDFFSVLYTFTAVEGDSSLWETKSNGVGTVKITKYNGEMSGSITIPNIVNGYLVTEIDSDVFIGESGLTSVTFSEGLQIIGARAFAQCTGLNCTLEFPSTLTNIGDQAFYYSTGITTNLDTLVSQKVAMGKNAFAGCSKITGDIAYFMKSVLDESTTTITEGMFSGFSGLTGDLTIPARITSIEANAFYNCSGIESISFESSEKLVTIGEYAFYNCSSMASDLTLPSTVTSIGAYAFYECTSLKSIGLSSALTSIGEYAFYNCSSATGTLTIPSGINTVEQYTFYDCSGLTAITFATGNTTELSIEKYAFTNTFLITTITFPADRKATLSNYSFNACGLSVTSLTVVNSGNITSLGSCAFYAAKSLTSFDFSGVTSVPESCFASCLLLTSLPEQNSCSSIGDSAFASCVKLGLSDGNTSFNIIEWIENSAVTSVGASAFKSCSQLTGTLTQEDEKNINGDTISIDGSSFTGTSVIYSIQLALEGKTSIADNEFAGVTEFVDSNKNPITDIVIPTTITSIGSYAFKSCTSITSITFTDNIESIGIGAFYGCSSLETIACYDSTGSDLTGYGLPQNENYTVIQANTFYGCGSLSNICTSKVIGTSYTPSGNHTDGYTWTKNEKATGYFFPSNIVEIGNNAFMNCTNLSIEIGFNKISTIQTYTFKNSGITGIVWGDSLTSIGQDFLNGTKVTGDLVIPTTVTTMDLTSLAIDSLLSSIYVGDSVTTITGSANMARYASSNLTQVTIKSTALTSIGNKFLCGCTNLTKVELPWANITSVGVEAFSGCSSWSDTVALTACTSIGNSAFYGCSNLNLTVYTSILTSYNLENSFTGLKSITYAK